MTNPRTNPMQGINDYGTELSPEDIATRHHRDAVGGLWDELGRLQFEFLRSRGLERSHHLADIGCGCLRGGVHFIDYLDPGHYSGLDINASLLEAGRIEVAQHGLEAKAPRLLLDDGFRSVRFQQPFDFMLSVSLFTHLPMNHILRCLRESREALKPGGVYYATYFEAPAPLWLEPLPHRVGGVTTHFDRDPFHYAFAEIEWMAMHAGLKAERIGEWEHPRDQMMAAFTVPGSPQVNAVVTP
jgi:SAM-dependent methyltransferase